MSMQQQTPQVAEPSPQKLALSVAFAGLISGLVIISIFEATLPTITANKAAELKAAVFKVLPGVASMKKLQYSDGGLSERTQEGADEDTVYGGYNQQGDLVGYAVAGEGPGFQDTIKLLYGYLPEQRKIVGMEILDSRETPGLGDKIFKDKDFVANFDGLAVDPQIKAVKKGSKSAPYEIDAITGATISSKAVVRIINGAHAKWDKRL
ncbi:FMN-binding protein [Candidatus Endoriftia persephonae]|uniref:Ion-translocating oxidoreductase complex subunit G n=3 Tax=Gammaproteobacteria TaxID=1236 RepID=G2FGL0_9GAMM|nr:FMN-binding protein [Candidatus Endoriftia persephone]EGW54121.1 electron transport complex protein RnfG [endosymbiont of Tevnia jerichonana (vent Tica)]KRT54066.1 Na+-translocating ferredoxin:NAD+ oxidoreductase RNF, RnfG subunit [endosymbiont of Ridgeia piscesae]KRT58939.1 electron transport complex protein RnfG [endosymbiont of Ridgeia piscesae]USF87624.1 FMN-binding protein [Candidatus Endoriftia persephone]